MVMFIGSGSYNEKVRLFTESGTFMMQARAFLRITSDVRKMVMLITLESYNE